MSGSLKGRSLQAGECWHKAVSRSQLSQLPSAERQSQGLCGDPHSSGRTLVLQMGNPGSKKVNTQACSASEPPIQKLGLSEGRGGQEASWFRGRGNPVNCEL